MSIYLQCNCGFCQDDYRLPKEPSSKRLEYLTCHCNGGCEEAGGLLPLGLSAAELAALVARAGCVLSSPRGQGVGASFSAALFRGTPLDGIPLDQIVPKILANPQLLHSLGQNFGSPCWGPQFFPSTEDQPDPSLSPTKLGRAVHNFPPYAMTPPDSGTPLSPGKLQRARAMFEGKVHLGDAVSKGDQSP